MSKEALKLALEALEHLQPTALTSFYTIGDRDKAIAALREALAEQPAQTDWEAVAADQAMTIALLKAEQPAQQEPVAYIEHHKAGDNLVWDNPGGKHTPLYTSQPARKPLTHEQRVDLLAKFEPHKHEWHAPAILIDIVEAAHNIKENT